MADVAVDVAVAPLAVEAAQDVLDLKPPSHP